ncbi:uncharacterized protein (TIGR02391 family) [Pedobacter sp. UYP30]|uniref:TIGR02391 family protein n=1 Tax=Pedobacter sp. UYP30 TaxID=1756400 RepID=UPI00339A88CB
MNKRKLLLLIEEILSKVSELELSAVMPKILTVAKQLNDKDFEKWILLETTGYFNTNPAMTDDIIVPEYRKVPGQYHDKYGRPFIIEDPILFEINNYPIREGVVELEDSSKKEGLLSFRNPFAMDTLRKNLGVEVDSFAFSANSLKTVINEIRNYIINWLINKQKETSNSLYALEINPEVPFELSGLHPIVQKTAGELYKNGHYRQAILDTYIALVEAVKVKSGEYKLDNTPLMQSVFSPKSPIIKVSENPDEQLGFMWLFSGAVMGIRNPKAHRLIEQNDPQRTLEWLCFASVLLRVIDDSELIKNEVIASIKI